jgi:hypothetical protein
MVRTGDQIVAACVRKHPILFSCCGLLFLATTAIVINSLVEGAGPFDNDFTISRSRLFKREELGYTQLPAYNVRGERFEFYLNQWNHGRFFGYCVFDVACWPDGDPGLGATNQLPAFVRRNEIYAMPAGLPLGIAAVAWGVWLYLVLRTRRKMRQLGFEVLSTNSTAS